MNSRTLAVFVIVILAVVGAALWFLQSAPPPQAPEILTSGPAPYERPMVPPPPANTIATQTALTSTPPSAAPVAKKPEPKPGEIAEWETRIDAVLRANPDNSEAANRTTAEVLINLLPTLPLEGQSEAAQHITNLLDDRDYNRVLAIVKNPQMSEEVLDVFVTDLMNRDDSVKLPVLLEIAKIPTHPHHEEAQTDLQIFLDEDFGTDWAKWETTMKGYLQKQAAEAAADAAAPPAVAPRK